MFWLSAFIDVPGDAFEESVAFWSAVTGWPPSDRRGVDGEFLTLVPPDDADDHLRMQRIGDGEPRVHLDVHVPDPRAAAARASALGATEVADPGHVVMRSPGGLTFCLVTHPASRPAPPSRWADLSTSLVDQVCLDVPRATYDLETGFWQQLLGWDRTGSSFAEFERLVRPEGQALRLLLQRLDDEDGPARAHLDVACSSRDREVVRHASLGARVVDERDAWTVLADPAGMRYCLTDRAPG
ncbi:VOC family protein [Nocardioides sediminis]|uniref:VOC family protein n=1 Tax=Nocardioides sediminis TaxID=433648 RepID=UPI000D31EED7|nr:VOC family protein [Nocardioides sediminis]